MVVAESPILRNVPNALTLSRLCVVPVFIALIVVNEGTTLAAGLLFMGAAFTDFFDGWYARRFAVMSQFGKAVDPIADRLLVNSAAILLSFYDARLFGPEFVVVVLRDVLALYGFRRLSQHVLPDVSALGKAGMFLMMGGLSWMLLLADASWPVWCFWAGLVVSIGVLGQYAWRYRWALPGRTPHQPPQG